MPVVSVWVMPMGILGVVADAVRLRRLLLAADGRGHRLDDRGRALGREPAGRGRPHGGVRRSGRCCSAAPGWWCCACSDRRLRLTGVALFAIASVWAARTPQPDVLIAADGLTFAVRGADGRLAIVRSGSDTFAARQWLAADGDARAHTDASLASGIRCDHAGCIGRLADGRLVALARSIEAFEEDCRRAAVVASPRDAPAHCAALVIDRSVLRRTGAVALRRTAEGFAISAVRPQGYDRPWAQARPSAADANARIDIRRAGARCHAAAGGPGARRLSISTAGTGRSACPGCARGWAAGCAPRRRCWPARARSRRRAGGSA